VVSGKLRVCSAVKYSSDWLEAHMKGVVSGKLHICCAVEYSIVVIGQRCI
jgi:hypothetical protein